MRRLLWIFVALAFAFVAIAPEAFAAPRVPTGVYGDNVVHQVKAKKKKKAKKKAKKKKKAKRKRGKKGKKKGDVPALYRAV